VPGRQLQLRWFSDMVKKRSAVVAMLAVGDWAMQLAVCAGCAFAGTLVTGPSFAQVLERPQSSLELIDPKALRVCADPHNLPFSTEKGEGFENKVAELLADKLGKGLTYAWYPQAPGFVRNTLAAHRCDVIMGAPQGDDLVQVTNPYYRTAYALVFKQGQGLEGVDTLEDARPQGQTHRHRGRHPARQQHGDQWSDGQRQALSARRRYARRFFRRCHDARP
jgi:hypothetical protein